MYASASAHAASGTDRRAGDSLKRGVHRHTCDCAHLSGCLPANGTSTCSNRQHAFIQSCPKLSAVEHIYRCVYFIWGIKTHTYKYSSFLMYIHICFTVTYLHEWWTKVKDLTFPHFFFIMNTHRKMCACSMYMYCVHTHTKAHFYSYTFKNTFALMYINTQMCMCLRNGTVKKTVFRF